MKSTTVTEASIRELVDAFYTKVRKDGLLSPVFVQAIGSNDDDWKGHLEQMYNFWSSIILGTGRYQGHVRELVKLVPSGQALMNVLVAGELPDGDDELALVIVAREEDLCNLLVNVMRTYGTTEWAGEPAPDTAQKQ